MLSSSRYASAGRITDFSCWMMRSRQDRGGGSNDSGSGHGFPQTEGCNLDTTTPKPCSYAQFAPGCKFVPESK